MRIISGKYKGRRLNPPKKLPVRPTTDMAKEALFNILNNRIYFDELSVLDLFSGTGSISFEFASRGTENITAVDQDYGCVKFINKTTEEFNMPINVIKSDVFKYLEKTTKTCLPWWSAWSQHRVRTSAWSHQGTSFSRGHFLCP